MKISTTLKMPRENAAFQLNGDKFRTHSEFDRSSVISERSDGFLNDFKLQPWMDKITGGTFRKEYLDKNLFRVR